MLVVALCRGRRYKRSPLCDAQFDSGIKVPTRALPPSRGTHGAHLCMRDHPHYLYVVILKLVFCQRISLGFFYRAFISGYSVVPLERLDPKTCYGSVSVTLAGCSKHNKMRKATVLRRVLPEETGGTRHSRTSAKNSSGKFSLRGRLLIFIWNNRIMMAIWPQAESVVRNCRGLTFVRPLGSKIQSTASFRTAGVGWSDSA